jgi:hypothetical protein
MKGNSQSNEESIPLNSKRQNREMLENMIAMATLYQKLFGGGTVGIIMLLILLGGLCDAILFGFFSKVLMFLVLCLVTGIIAALIASRIFATKLRETTTVSETSSFGSSLLILKEPFILIPLLAIALAYFINKSHSAESVGSILLIVLIAGFLSLPLFLLLGFLWYKFSIWRITKGHKEIAYVDRTGLQISEKWIYSSTDIDKAEVYERFFESELKGRINLF